MNGSQKEVWLGLVLVFVAACDRSYVLGNSDGGADGGPDAGPSRVSCLASEGKTLCAGECVDVQNLPAVCKPQWSEISDAGDIIGSALVGNEVSTPFSMTFVPSKGAPCAYSGSSLTGGLWEFVDSKWVNQSDAPTITFNQTTRMVYDEAREAIFLYGSFSETRATTWEFDGKNWSSRSEAISDGRVDFDMVYDSLRGRVILFGGSDVEYLGDTWEWNGQEWKELKPAHAPSPRSRHAMAYDRARDRIVLFGGKDRINSFSDTWEFDGIDWREVTVSNAPFRRRVYAMAYDDRRERTILVAGKSAASLSSNDDSTDLWEWDGALWTQRRTTGTPPEFAGSFLTYDTSRQRFLFIGGGGYYPNHRFKSFELIFP